MTISFSTSPIERKLGKHKHYATNTVGRDFVVGDLHGCLDDMYTSLAILNFDTKVDRLFSVGDLIDRGPKCFETAELIYQPWFKSVQGNHERLMIDALIKEDGNMAACWYQNGGDWRFSHDEGELRALAKDLQKLPLVISVGEGKDRFNIVHAEFVRRDNTDGHGEIVPVSDRMIDSWTFEEDDEQALVWGRTMVSYAKTLHNHTTVRYNDASLSPTYVGHTPLRQSIIIEKQIYIDNGAVFCHMSQNKSVEDCLTFAEPNKKVLHKFSIVNQTIETVELDTLLRYCQ